MEKLKRRIKDRFRTQREFAKAVGMTETSLSRHLRGERSWKAVDVLKVAEVLEIPDSEVRSYFFESPVAIKATTRK